MGEEDPLPTDYDERFREDLKRIKREDGSRFETVTSRCEAIRRYPFKGEWKKWKMEGLYGEHVDSHWVILYEIEPNLSPNHPESAVESIYFHRVVHHDKQKTAVTNISAIGSSLSFEVAIPYELEGNRRVSRLHDSDLVRVDDPEYRDEIYVSGQIPESDEAREEVIQILPDELEVEFEQISIRDITN